MVHMVVLLGLIPITNSFFPKLASLLFGLALISMVKWWIELSPCGGDLDVSSSSLQILEGRLCCDGKPYEGHTLRLFKDGSISRKIAYKDGLKHGEDRTLYRSGKVAAQRYFYTGLPHGKQYKWFENGDVSSTSMFDHGIPTGVHVSYFPNGSQSDTREFRNGKLYHHKIWRRSGQIYANYKMVNGRGYGMMGAKLCLEVKDKE